MAKDTNLNVRLAMNNRQLVTALKQSTQAINKFGSQARRQNRHTAKSFGFLKRAATVALGAIMARANVTQIKQLVNTLDALAKSADAVGLTVQQWTALRGIVTEAGVDGEKFAKAYARLNKVIIDASDGLTTYVRAFDRLGVEITDSNGKLKDTQTIFFELKEAADRLGASQNVTASFMDIFGGRLGHRMIRAMTDMEGSMEKVTARGREMGVVIEEDVVRRAEELRNQWDLLGMQFTAAGARMTEGLIPQLKTLAEWMGEVANSTDHMVAQIKEAHVRIGQAFSIPAVVGDSMLRRMTGRSQEGGLAHKFGSQRRAANYKDSLGPGLYRLPGMATAADGRASPGAGSSRRPAMDLAKNRKAVVADAVAMNKQFLEGKRLAMEMDLKQDLELMQIEDDERKRQLEERIREVQEFDAALNTEEEAISDFAAALDSNLSATFSNVIAGTQSVGDAFRSMIGSIISQVIQQSIISPIAGGLAGAVSGGLGSVFGGPTTAPSPKISTFPGKAAGGAVHAGRPITVGEHGRELFVPSSGGRVLSHPQTERAMSGEGGGGISLTFNVDSTDGPGVRRAIQEAVPAIVQAVKGSMMDDLGRPSPMRQAVRGYG